MDLSYVSWRMFLLTFALYCNFTAVFSACPHAQMLKAQGGNDALTNANNFMLDRYTEAKGGLLSQTHDAPLIVLQDTNLTLFVNGKQHQQAVLQWVEYDNVKMCSHLPFAALLLTEPSVYLQEDPSVLVPVSQHDLDEIASYVSLINQVIADLPTCCNFSGEVLQRQLEISLTVQKFLTNVLKTQHVSHQLIKAMSNATVNHINQNVMDASVIYINNMHSIVMDWKSQLTPPQWASLRVIVMGSHMPRNGSLQLQYFTRLLDTPEFSGLRVIFAEHVDNMEDAMDLLGTHLLDFSAAKNFWNDEDHLHSDVQAAAATEYLNQLFPQRRVETREAVHSDRLKSVEEGVCSLRK